MRVFRRGYACRAAWGRSRQREVHHLPYTAQGLLFILSNSRGFHHEATFPSHPSGTGCPVGFPIVCGGPGRLAGQAHHAGVTLCAWRHDRPAGALVGIEAAGRAGPDRHRRKQGRRGRQYWHRLCGQGQARRLYVFGRLQRPTGDCAFALSETALPAQHRLHGCRADCQCGVRDCGQSQVGADQHQGHHCQGKNRRSGVCVCRLGNAAAHHW